MTLSSSDEAFLKWNFFTNEFDRDVQKFKNVVVLHKILMYKSLQIMPPADEAEELWKFELKAAKYMLNMYDKIRKPSSKDLSELKTKFKDENYMESGEYINIWEAKVIDKLRYILNRYLKKKIKILLYDEEPQSSINTEFLDRRRTTTILGVLSYPVNYTLEEVLKAIEEGTIKKLKLQTTPVDYRVNAFDQKYNIHYDESDTYDIDWNKTILTIINGIKDSNLDDEKVMEYFHEWMRLIVKYSIYVEGLEEKVFALIDTLKYFFVHLNKGETHFYIWGERKNNEAKNNIVQIISILMSMQNVHTHEVEEIKYYNKQLREDTEFFRDDLERKNFLDGYALVTRMMNEYKIDTSGKTRVDFRIIGGILTMHPEVIIYSAIRKESIFKNFMNSLIKYFTNRLKIKTKGKKKKKWKKKTKSRFKKYVVFMKYTYGQFFEEDIHQSQAKLVYITLVKFIESYSKRDLEVVKDLIRPYVGYIKVLEETERENEKHRKEIKKLREKLKDELKKSRKRKRETKKLSKTILTTLKNTEELEKKRRKTVFGFIPVASKVEAQSNKKS